MYNITMEMAIKQLKYDDLNQYKSMIFLISIPIRWLQAALSLYRKPPCLRL
jgi:hypothetical protein